MESNMRWPSHLSICLCGWIQEQFLKQLQKEVDTGFWNQSFLNTVSFFMYLDKTLDGSDLEIRFPDMPGV